ncbi:hypothetical protein Q2T46_02335 [Thermoanaerobacterium sp. CMT5567-10]|uniref:hypothetical protein n=1 Tax=Thermoanaerobacterium sp. CMT5567-10 TaxID=3061989 RepID=UPI0026DEB708|nr:hypothetical protein [Thermoanaerobacterium sp. CMT5567-10]WKV09315.1 hypothetical protein Q2T46_02335 [Thermoanaerobacterium sp. CMT5567-10]
MKLNMYNVGNCIIGNSEVDIDDVHEILGLLIEKYGEDTMIEFIKNHENGQNLSDAFKNALSNKNMITKLKVKKIF